MKKVFKLFCPLAIFPLLYIPYHFLNTKVIVEWLGCGCPQFDEYGNEITRVFNANDFTMCFWICIAGVVTLLSIFNLKLLEKWHWKVLYLLFIAAVSIFIALKFYYSMHWL